MTNTRPRIVAREHKPERLAGGCRCGLQAGHDGACEPMLDRDDISLLTVREAAGIAGVALKTMWNWVDRYELTRHRIDGRIYLSEREVLDCEAAREQAGHRAHLGRATRRGA